MHKIMIEGETPHQLKMKMLQMIGVALEIDHLDILLSKPECNQQLLNLSSSNSQMDLLIGDLLLSIKTDSEPGYIIISLSDLNLRDALFIHRINLKDNHIFATSELKMEKTK